MTFGKKIHSCPYFAARHMMEWADLILCPYNYLIDPVIRDSVSISFFFFFFHFKKKHNLLQMLIKLKDQVVIIDEAHNIENICRDVGSTTFREDHLAEIIDDCRLVFVGTNNSVYQELQYYLEKFLNMIQNQALPETVSIVD